ncbi:DUF4352 domain-containing protein [Methanosphaerula subterraneus]|uniref:DUF4352 domain-containing protein n=1 Tax=Methanosphaerula subterraneus TaxID=3350244 RepID=UPI003F840C72
MRYFTFFTILVILAISAGCLSSGFTSSTTAKLTTSVTPSSATTEKIQVTVNGYGAYVPDNQQYMATPRPGYSYLLVDLSVKNTGHQGGYLFNPIYVQVEDPDGAQYSIADVNPPDRFSMGSISYGETRRGKLVFEVLQKPTGTTYKVVPLLLS